MSDFAFRQNAVSFIHGFLYFQDEFIYDITEQKVILKNFKRECTLYLPYKDNGLDYSAFEEKFKKARKYLTTGVVDEVSTAVTDADLP